MHVHMNVCVYDDAQPVIEEKLLPLLDGSLGKNPNAVVSIHHDNCKESVKKILNEGPNRLTASMSSFI